ncbi:MAG: response regulator [Balneolaceae bacterium]|nr:response regulator [Balneolaceae bacterium]MCH8549553.1 response regulator [Balneolaceae bacterium]
MTENTSQDIKILVIEDNEGDFVLIEEYLAEQNVYTVDHATNYEEAKKWLGKKGYSSILLDLTLPDKSGEELIQGVMSKADGVPVIVLTGYSDMSFSIHSLALGVSDYLLKDELTPLGLWKSIRYGIERRLTSRHLKESEEKYRYLFERNPLPMVIWDLKTRTIADSNREARLTYGYNADEFREMTIDELKVDDTVGLPDEEDAASVEDMGPESAKVWRHRKKNGELFFAEVNGHMIDYRGERSVLFMVQDVSEKIEVQERMVESALRAEESERNRIARELHDGIVQQLAACGMFVQNLYNLAGDNDPLQDEISRLHELIRKTTVHTRDISHKLKSAEFEELPISKLLEQLILQLTHVSNIQFHFKNYLKNEKTDVDTALKINIYRSVQELCNNIIKHSGAQNAYVTAEEIGNTIFISIKDDGIGLKDEAMNGTGLGLANVKNRVQRYGGQIVMVQTGDSSGVRVDIEIPLIFED